MKVILVQSIENLGDAGDVINVKSGYGRNYLIPKGFAVSANKKSIISLQKDLERKELKEAKTVKGLTLLSTKLNKETLKFELKAGEDDKLFGSVTAQMISDELQNKGYSIDKKDIFMDESIKSIISSDKRRPLQIKLHSCLFVASVKTSLKFLKTRGSPPVNVTRELSGNCLIKLTQSSEVNEFFCFVS